MNAATRRFSGWTDAPDDLLLDSRRAIAQAIRVGIDDVPARVRTSLRDRALLIELAETAAAVRELLVEVEAIGLSVEVGS